MLASPFTVVGALHQPTLNGIAPTIVADVGHTISTMEKHYKRIAIRKMEPELLMVNRRRLSLSLRPGS